MISDNEIPVLQFLSLSIASLVDSSMYSDILQEKTQADVSSKTLLLEEKFIVTYLRVP